MQLAYLSVVRIPRDPEILGLGPFLSLSLTPPLGPPRPPPSRPQLVLFCLASVQSQALLYMAGMARVMPPGQQVKVRANGEGRGWVGCDALRCVAR